MIWIVVAIIFIVSIILSVRSLLIELKKTKHEKDVEAHLSKSKVLFYSPSGSESSDEVLG